MAKSLQRQIEDAWDSTGAEMTLAELRSAAGLEVDLTSLSRKLRGKQVMTTAEAEAIATVLRVKLSYGREARAS